MNKRHTIRLLAAVAALLLLLGCPAGATLVEQTQVNLPEIDVYLYEEEVDLEGIEEADIAATLDGVPLDIVDLSLSTQPIQYCYMLDISGSMPVDHFIAVKRAILAQWDALRPGDELALFSFGEEVKLRLSGGESREEVEEALANVWRGELHTQFYEAMSTLVQYLEPMEDKRCVAVVVSDGVEASQDGMSREELENTLRLGGVAVNGLCIDTEEADAEAFAEFVHLTGGELYRFGPDDAEPVLKDLVSRLDDGWHLVLTAPGFDADNSTRTLQVDLAGKSTVVTQVKLDRAMQDETPPQVLSAEYLPETRQLSVQFSEAMSAPTQAEAYSLLSPKGELLALTDEMLTYVPPSNSVLLRFAELPVEGVYTLSISGLRDASSMENEMTPYQGRVQMNTGVTPPPTPTVPPTPAPVAVKPKLDLQPLYIAGGIGVAAVVALVVLLVVLGRRRQKADSEKPARTRRVKQARSAKTVRFVFVEDAATSPKKKTNKKEDQDKT